MLPPPFPWASCAPGVAAPPVPRADVLADVAAEDVAPHAVPALLGDGALDLDGQVADAARGVEDVGGREGAGGTRVQAGGAAPAHVRPRGVSRQVEVGDGVRAVGVHLRQALERDLGHGLSRRAIY